ncbi:MAG: polyphosphate kinase 1, partial [Acidimicrobiia bacterium]|nr:polyphosphate kinase 1 [Acidimicrobiia bacterium]
ERVKFVAIFSSNLDEYFQVRVAGLKDQVAAGVTAPSPDGRLPTEQLLLVRERCEALIAAAEQVFLDDVVPALADESVSFVTWADLDNDDRKVLTALFDERVFPVLTPLAVDPGHPFPYISDLSLNLAVVVDDRATGARRFARVKVPSILPRFVELPDGRRFLPLEQLIAAHLDGLFPGMDVETHHAFRVTRNADLTLEEEEADDLLAAVEIEVRRRRFGRAVRLELESTATAEVRELLQRELDLDDDDVYLSRAPLGLGGLWALHALDRPELKDRPWSPVTQPRLMGSDDRPRSFFRELRRGDILVHHPYESFATSVEEFIRQASEDPKVLAIKMTLYRTSGDSSIIESLIRAAERGKQVVALVELKARFDEEANIEWARELERAGVHVVYGLVGLKTHTKITLVVRDEPDGIRRYCHVGTGNYNPKTARLYEDLGLLTCDPDIGADLSVLFNYLTGYGRDVHYRKLLVAPAHLRDGITHLVEQEMAADESPHIFMKMNSLVDSKMIDLLYRASQQGVQVDLVIRGICCLRPGVPGLSENIRVRSVVGRYLEHSRIFWFAHGGPDGDGSFTIGSADLMPRNLDRRIEALTPIGDPDLRRRLTEHMEVLLSDDTLAWEMAADGSWHKLAGPAGVDTHLTLQEHARQQWGRRS